MLLNICSGAIRWQLPEFLSDGIVMFALSHIIFEILIFKMFDLERLGRSHRVQHSQ